MSCFWDSCGGYCTCYFKGPHGSSFPPPPPNLNLPVFCGLKRMPSDLVSIYYLFKYPSNGHECDRTGSSVQGHKTGQSLVEA
mmetsp:Transcript_142974/g.249493  ORF Transcript_142974/g.249493 Transcript_142974/m.249493 type:complete len:82 (-) Transcript_142974:808-1053(-)